MTHRLLSAAAVREVVWERQLGTCLACHAGMHRDEFDAHHRTRRRDLGWCPCNVVGLHHTCHVVAPGSVHQEPGASVERGLIVPSWADPRQVPLEHRVPWSGRLFLWCDGHVSGDPME